MAAVSNEELKKSRLGVIRINTDPRVLLILLAFCEKNIVRYFVLAVSMIPFVGRVSSLIIPLLYTILFLLYIKKYGINLSISEIGVVVFAAFSILLSCLIYPENSKYILASNNLWNTIAPCFKFYVLGLLFIPNRYMMDLLGKASIFAIIVESLFVVLYMIPNGLVNADDMNRSYQILPNVLLALNYAFTHKKIAHWLLSLLGVFYCVSMGTRGPILIILVYIYL